MHGINTSRRLGASQFSCLALGTTALHAARPLHPLGAPSSPSASSERDGGKRTSNLWEHRGAKNQELYLSSSTTAAWHNLTHLPPDSHSRSETFLLTGKVPNDGATDNISAFFSSTWKEHPAYFFQSSSSMIDIADAHLKAQPSKLIGNPWEKNVCD